MWDSSSPLYPDLGWISPCRSVWWQLRLAAAYHKVSREVVPRHTGLCGPNSRAGNAGPGGMVFAGSAAVAVSCAWLRQLASVNLLIVIILLSILTDSHAQSVAQTTGDTGPVEVPPETAPESVGVSRSVCQHLPGQAPEMVIIPPGSFMMGNGKGEPNESPAHRVTINQPFALGRCEITVAEFREFVQSQTPWYVTDAERNGGCWSLDSDLEIGQEEGANWQNPFPIVQSRDIDDSSFDAHPVTCVSHNDAKAYIDWVNSKYATEAYRLPAEAELEYALRHGGEIDVQWPDDQICRWANTRDLSYGEIEITGTAKPSDFYACSDGYAFTSPVGSFPANPFGLFDLFGNVWEWAEDCWHESYQDAPANGTAWVDGCAESETRVLRGGAWANDANFVRSAIRDSSGFVGGGNDVGFRLARTLPQ